MPISESTLFPSRLTKIDEITRPDHWYLTETDECLYFGEYTAREGFSYSTTNQLILNFKKPMSAKGKSGWQYKRKAILQAASAFSDQIGQRFSKLTLVPVPPSKHKSDPLYDDRICEMLRLMRPSTGTVDWREIVTQTTGQEAAHDSDHRPPPEEWENLYEIDETQTEPEPKWIAIIDDLLVTGCRFRAMSNVLSRRFPEARITGLFLARRKPKEPDFSAFFEETDQS